MASWKTSSKPGLEREFKRLERRLDELVGVVAQLKEENRALRQRQDTPERGAGDADAEERTGAGARRSDDRPPQGDGERRMSADHSRVSVRILEKDYHVACPAEERAALLDSAEYLNRKMREIRDSGKVVGLDRIAVMAALNIVNELLQSRGHDEGVETDLAARIKAMRERVESALTRGQQLETECTAARAQCASANGLAPPAVFDLGLGTSRP